MAQQYLIVLDITMPGHSGLEVAVKLRKAGFDRPILMFTMHQSEQLGNDALQAGAQGSVLKSEAAEQLVEAIDALLAGETFYGKTFSVYSREGGGRAHQQSQRNAHFAKVNLRITS